MPQKLFNLICLCALQLLCLCSVHAKNKSHVIARVKLTAAVNKLNQHAEIRWHTLPGENNMLRFELQKSMDGYAFSYLTSVAGNGQGSLKEYFAEDKNVQPGTSFYRLKIVYKDGYETYSSLAQITPPTAAVTILPSVTNDRVYIWLPDNIRILSASIADASGKIIYKNAAITAGVGIADIDVKKLEPGFYNVILQTVFAQKLHLKFSKK